MTEGRVHISVVIPVLNEQDTVQELYQRLEQTLAPYAYEIVFVDDGSTDKTPALLARIRSVSQRVKIIRMRKTAGQSLAFLAGFRYAGGDIVVTMDADLQNDPADIPALLHKMGEGHDLVSGWRQTRKDPLVRKVISAISNQCIAARTGVRLRDFGCALTAARRALIERLQGCGESAIFIKPMLVTLARSAGEVTVSHRARAAGRSHYNIFLIIAKGLQFLARFDASPRRPAQPLPFEHLIESVL